MVGCSSDMDELRMISKFHDQYLENEKDESHQVHQKTKLYLDFSPSVLRLLDTYTNYITYSHLKKVLPTDTQVYYFADHQPVAFSQEINASMLHQMAQQKDSVSLIKEVLKTIVSENQNAVLVTDFEYIPREKKMYRAMTQQGDTTFTLINPYPWVTPIFFRWFQAGNSIRVVSFPNFKTVRGHQKHLYVLFFTTSNTHSDLSDVFSENAHWIKQDFVSYHFSGLNIPKIKPKHTDRFSGVVHSDIDNVSFYENKQVEYYSLPHKFLEKKNDSTHQNIVLHHLIPQFDTALYQHLSFEIQVTDLTENFSYFMNFQEHEPIRYGIDPNTGDSTVIKAPSISFRFTGGLPVNNLFQVVYDSIKNDLSVRLLSQSNQIDGNEPSKLYALTIYLTHIDFKSSQSLQKNLQAIHEKGFRNESLYQSLLNAYPKEIEPSILYQCYLRFR